jgi:glycosyltransferase involved in cell wall biosynthesis
VISTYVAGIPELVQDGRNGWLVPAGDVDALVAAIQQCLDAPPDVLQKMADTAFKKVAVLHSVDRQASKLASLFRKDFRHQKSVEANEMESQVRRLEVSRPSLK